MSRRLDTETLHAGAAEFAAQTLPQQKALLLEALDKNMLYVPLSEADSREFDLTAEEQALNRAFYQRA